MNGQFLKNLLEKLDVLQRENALFVRDGIRGIFNGSTYFELTAVGAMICYQLASVLVGPGNVIHFGIELKTRDSHFPNVASLVISERGLNSLIEAGKEFLKVLPQE